MDILKLSVYERLRDCNVPAAVLDDIFANQDDLNILIKSWQDLQSGGMTQDEIASKVSEMIFNELDIDPQSIEEK